jgi:hypothetical protein
MKLSLALTVALTGCIGTDLELDLDVSYGTVVDVYTDGTTVRVLGCTRGAFLGCDPEPPGAVLAVTVDGVVHDSTRDEPGEADEVMSLFRTGNLRVSAPAPVDGVVGIDLAGYAADVALPPVFGISSPGHVRRGAAIAVTYEPVPGARADGADAIAILETTCGATSTQHVLAVQAAGEVVLELGEADGGDCTHTLQLDQSHAQPGPRVIVVARATFTSMP